MMASFQHPEHEATHLDRRLWASAFLNLAVTLIEFAGGLWAGSLALLADSAHNLTDAGSLGLAIFARRLGRRAPTARHTYGFKRGEVTAALLNAAALIAISALVAREAVARILHPEPMNAPVMLVAAVVALVVNLASVFLLRTHSAEDINVRSAFLHLLQDALASPAVVIAALFARTAAGVYVDPAAAILIGIIVLRSALAIVWESLHTLLEAAPANLNNDYTGMPFRQTFGGRCARFGLMSSIGPYPTLRRVRLSRASANRGRVMANGAVLQRMRCLRPIDSGQEQRGILADVMGLATAGKLSFKPCAAAGISSWQF
jgi:cation diffusion facilitator family transporter